jgi:16S rRNA processing protein RimM
VPEGLSGEPGPAGDRDSGADGGRRLRAGTVGRAHGLDGSFHVGAVAAAVFALVEVGDEVMVGDRRRRVTRVAGHAARPILRLEGCADRPAAEALTGTEIYLPRESAPALEPDEWWAEDLEGLEVRDGDRVVGTVSGLLELPSCEVLEVVRPGDAPDLLVPLIADAVRDVDLEAGVVDVDLVFLGEE